MDDATLTKLHEQLKLLAPKGKTGGLGYYVAAGGKSWRTAAESMPREKRMLYSRFVREGEAPKNHIQLKGEAQTEESTTKRIRKATHEISNGNSVNRRKRTIKKTVSHQDAPLPNSRCGGPDIKKKEKKECSKAAIDDADGVPKKKTRKCKKVDSYQAKLLAIDASYAKAAKRKAAAAISASKTATKKRKL